MRIGIDGHVLGKNIGGVERFVYELQKHLPAIAPEHEYFVFVTKNEFARIMASTQTIPSHVQFIPLFFSNPLLERLIVLPWLVYQFKLNALLIQRLAPWYCGSCKLILTIHDLTPIKFAHSYQGLTNRLIRLLTKNSIERAHLILTPTKTIKTEITHYCPAVSAPIVAFYNGVDLNKFHQHGVCNTPQLIKAPYLFSVGAIESRKNIETILSAFSKLPATPYRLVILGPIRDEKYHQQLLKMAVTLGIQSKVDWLGFVKDDVLVELYRGATLFITASKDEGFNIPPLEAMACKIPVLCSDIPVHRELFEGAVDFFTTESSDALAQKIMTLTEDKARSGNLVNSALEKVQLYNWITTSHNVAASFRLLETS